MKSSLKNASISPRKVGLVARLAKRFSKVNEVIDQLRFVKKKAAGLLLKCILSAVSNSKLPSDKLLLVDIKVGRGTISSRFNPRARGNSNRILKYSTNLYISLRESFEAIGKSEEGVAPSDEKINEPKGEN